MSDVLLARVIVDHHPDYQYFDDEKQMDFEVNVLNGEPLQLRASSVYYLGSAFLKNKVKTINEELNVDRGAEVVAIDKYPHTHFTAGAKKINLESYRNLQNVFARYEIECLSENWKYDSVILLVPGLEPIVLSTLKIACNVSKGYSSSSITFEHFSVLSVRSLLGEIIGIPLIHCNTGDLRSPLYRMSFERVSSQAVILQSALDKMAVT